MAEYSGLVEGVTEALIGTYRGAPVHAPGRVFTDLAVAVADGADAISGISVVGDRQDLFGPVASMPTTWRVLDRVAEENLPTVRAARARARAAAWAAGAGPDLDAGGVPGLRCHHHDRAQREEECRGDLEEDVRVPPG